MSRRATIGIGVACLLAGFLAWGMLTPAFVPGAGPSEARWQRAAFNVSLVSFGSGALFGCGALMLALSLFRKKPRDL